MANAPAPNKPRSLRGQLIGLVAALVVPLVAVQLWWGYRESQRAMEAVAVEALAVADETALSVGQFLSQGESIMMAAASEFGQLFFSGEPCGGYMAAITNLFPFLTSASTVDRDGNVICSSIGGVPEGTSAVDWVWFPGMVEEPGFLLKWVI